jgi:hypothetical protein
MLRKLHKRRLIGLVLALGLVAAAPATAAPPSVDVPDSLARIQYPGTSSLPTVFVTPTTGASSDSSFDWASAGVGAGFLAGLGVLAVGVALALRRRRSLAHA